jgi:hypothetical protein
MLIGLFALIGEGAFRAGSTVVAVVTGRESDASG